MNISLALETLRPFLSYFDITSVTVIPVIGFSSVPSITKPASPLLSPISGPVNATSTYLTTLLSTVSLMA